MSFIRYDLCFFDHKIKACQRVMNLGTGLLI